jgi:hypothetical protein
MPWASTGTPRSTEATKSLTKVRAERGQIAGIEKQLADIEETASALTRQLLSLLDILQDADATPTPQAVLAAGSLLKRQSAMLAGWDSLRKQISR